MTGDNVEKYDGKVKAKPLRKFLDKFAPALKNTENNGDDDEEAEKEEKKVPKTPPQETLWRLTSGDDFTQYCVDRPGTCVIGLLDPEGDGFDGYKKVSDDDDDYDYDCNDVVCRLWKVCWKSTKVVRLLSLGLMHGHKRNS